MNSTRKWGGVKTWSLTFAEELRKLGHENFVWAREGVFQKRCREVLGHGESFNFGPDFNPLAIIRFMALFKKNRIDILVINVGKDLTTAGIAARLLGIPVVQRIGLPGDIALKPRTEKVHQWIRPQFLCPCRFVAEGFMKELPYVRSEDVKVILNGKVPAQSPVETSSRRELVMTSQLIPTKKHEQILEAIKNIKGNYRLNIVGTGSRDTELVELASEFGVDDRVVFSGFTSDVGAVLVQSDIFVLASVSEGLPNTLLEAMASGLLPVARDVGGVREIWPEELSQFLLPFSSGPDDFRRVLEKALSLSDDNLHELKDAARRTCEERFSLKGQVEELEGWLNGLC